MNPIKFYNSNFKVLPNLNLSLKYSIFRLFPKEFNKINNIELLKGNFENYLKINKEKNNSFPFLLSSYNMIKIILLIEKIKNKKFSHITLINFTYSNNINQIIGLSFCYYNFFLSSTKNQELVVWEKNINKNHFLPFQIISDLTQYNIDFIQEIKVQLLVSFCYYESIFNFWSININTCKLLNDGNLLLDLSPYTKNVFLI